MALTMLWITKFASVLIFLGVLAVAVTGAENQTCSPSTESSLTSDEKSNSSQNTENNETQLLQDSGTRQQELNSTESTYVKKESRQTLEKVSATTSISTHKADDPIKQSDLVDTIPSNYSNVTERNETDSFESHELNSTVPSVIDNNSSSEHSIAKRNVQETELQNITSESIGGPSNDTNITSEDNDTITTHQNKTILSVDLHDDNATSHPITPTIDIAVLTSTDPDDIMNKSEDATGQLETTSDYLSVSTIDHINAKSLVDSTPTSSPEYIENKTSEVTSEVFKSHSKSDVLSTEIIPVDKVDIKPVAKSRGQRSPDKPKESIQQSTTETLQYSSSQTTDAYPNVVDKSSPLPIENSSTVPIDYFDAVLNESFISSSNRGDSSTSAKEFETTGVPIEVGSSTETIYGEGQGNESSTVKTVSLAEVASSQVFFTTQLAQSTSTLVTTSPQIKATTVVSEKSVVSTSSETLTPIIEVEKIPAPTNETLIDERNNSEIVVSLLPKNGKAQNSDLDDVLMNDSPVEPLIEKELRTENSKSQNIDTKGIEKERDNFNNSRDDNTSLGNVNTSPQGKQTPLEFDKKNTADSEVPHFKDITEIPISNDSENTNFSEVSSISGSQSPSTLAVTISTNSNISDTTLASIDITEKSKNLVPSNHSPDVEKHLISQQTTTVQSVENTLGDAKTSSQEPLVISSTSTVETNSSSIIEATSITPEISTRRNLGNLKPKLPGSRNAVFTRPTTTTTTKRPTQSNGGQVSIFNRSRTRSNSITSSTTPGTTTRRIYRGYNKTLNIVGTESFSFDLLPMTTPSTTTTTEAEEEEEEEEDVMELEEEPHVPSHEDEKSSSYSDYDDVTLMKYSASTVVNKGMKWKQQLNSRSSPEYKKQVQNMHSALDKLFRGSAVGPNLWKIEIDGFDQRPGSRAVEVDYSVYLVKTDTTLETIELVRAFNERLINNTYSRYTFDPMFTNFAILHEEKLNKPTDSPEVEPPIPQWAVAVIVIGAASFIFIVLFAAVTVYGRHHMKRRYTSKLDEDMERSVDSREWEKKLGAAAYENLAADVAYDADDNFVGSVDSTKRAYYMD